MTFLNYCRIFSLQNNAKLVSFTEGETLDAERDPRGGLYIIISGLVKVILC